MWSANDMTIQANLRKRTAINLLISLTPMFDLDSLGLSPQMGLSALIKRAWLDSWWSQVSRLMGVFVCQCCSSN